MSSPLSAIIALGRAKRATLAYGPEVELVNHDDSEIVTKMPLRLYEALTSNKELVTANMGVRPIVVPSGILPVSVKVLVSRVSTLTDPKVDVLAMKSTGNLHKDLQIASAAEALGLSKYTQSMVNAHWHRLKSNTLTPVDIHAISKVDTLLGNKWLAIFTRDLTVLIKRFEAAYTAIMTKWKSDAKAFAVREARCQRRAEQEALAKEHARRVAAKQPEEHAKERAKYDAIKKEEAEYHYKVYGKRVPVAPGHK
ncbi:hypothetical protein EK21DRAFT_110027 [Setomelanomma holmii]|uniref:Uncharacterized protein n=1 Tax=Setomelanomma holmii TaxID=210430 RepID=A0A9P4HE40_9PLEO|nr:hypothetical protein EK21DRAFT_110027 [Setomelanomma holmii]